jgi:predicted Rossmann fold flavoprotein
LSGPAALDLSRWAQPGDRLTLDVLSREAGNRELARARVLDGFERAGARSVRSVVRALTPSERLAELFLARAGLAGERKAAGVGRAERHRLADLLCDLPLGVRGVGGFEVAMVTAGGVALEEVDPATLESRLVPGLFLAGEVLDVDGDCGGYNLQAAFSTGHLAADGIRALLAA